MFDLGLLDLELAGGLFTWSNGRSFQSWSRIDRFLVCPAWESMYPKLIQSRLPRLFLDHFPILLESGRFGGSKKPFCFENMWL